MAMFVWFVVGGFTAWLAKKMIKGRGFGLPSDIFVGIVGGLICGMLAALFFQGSAVVDGGSLSAILFAFLGGVVFMVVVYLYQLRRNVSRQRDRK